MMHIQLLQSLLSLFLGTDSTDSDAAIPLLVHLLVYTDICQKAVECKTTLKLAPAGLNCSAGMPAIFCSSVCGQLYPHLILKVRKHHHHYFGKRRESVHSHSYKQSLYGGLVVLQFQDIFTEISRLIFVNQEFKFFRPSRSIGRDRCKLNFSKSRISSSVYDPSQCWCHPSQCQHLSQTLCRKCYKRVSQITWLIWALQVQFRCRWGCHVGYAFQ